MRQDLDVGSVANFERSARMGDEIGGHHVSGHVDCKVRAAWGSLPPAELISHRGLPAGTPSVKGNLGQGTWGDGESPLVTGMLAVPIGDLLAPYSAGL